MHSINGTPPPRTLVDLGLAISGATMMEGQTRTLHDIKCFIDATIEVITGTKRTISSERIRQIEARALRKLRHPAQKKKLR